MRNVARVGGVKRRGGGGEGEIPYPIRRLLRRLWPWVVVAWVPRLFLSGLRFRPRICRPAADTKVSRYMHTFFFPQRQVRRARK